MWQTMAIFCSSCLLAHWFCSYSTTTKYIYSLLFWISAYERYCNIKAVISFHNSQPIILFEKLESRYRNQHLWWCHIWGRGWLEHDDDWWRRGRGLTVAKMLMTWYVDDPVCTTIIINTIIGLKMARCLVLNLVAITWLDDHQGLPSDLQIAYELRIWLVIKQ